MHMQLLLFRLFNNTHIMDYANRASIAVYDTNFTINLFISKLNSSTYFFASFLQKASLFNWQPNVSYNVLFD